MTLRPGDRLGPYEIVSQLGKGGMGEVYRARDGKLNRNVALKILPEPFASDPDRRARFQREAHVLAALNHPNIAAIYGLEDGQSVHALVLELVEGPTLADRIVAGPLPIDEVLSISSQITEALEAAHEHGIVHRDLKPANIKVRPDGAVKVLDFGLAKILAAEAVEMSAVATATSPAATREGIVLGTAAYMAPEQATGRPADARSDMWAFGLLLFEMLTGRRGFEGETAVEVLSNILKTEPHWAALPPSTPAAVRSLLRRCLQKDPAKRLRHIVDARFQFEDARDEITGHVDSIASRPRQNTRARWGWIAALVTTTAASAAMAWYAKPSPHQPESRLDITTPPTTDPTSLAISDDGRMVAFVATSDGRSLLWLRALGSTSARPLAGTENATHPFWSPDGHALGFSANQQLKRVDVESGSVQLLARGGDNGGAWNADGTLLFSGNPAEPLFTIPAQGGERRAVTKVNKETENHRYPEFLPDQRHFLFYAPGQSPGIYVSELGSDHPPQRILENVQAAKYTSGHLFFVRQGTLFSQTFDAATLRVAGDPIPIADRIVVGSVVGSAALAVSATGQIVYRTGGDTTGLRELTWFDRSGKTLNRVSGPAAAGRSSISLSPDGHRVAFEQVASGETTTDIWMLDLDRAVSTRLTSDPAYELYPQWSPDGRYIAFSSNRPGVKGAWDLYRKSTTGSGTDELLLSSESGDIAQGDWSPDGRYLLYARGTETTPFDLMALPVGDRNPFPVVATPFSEYLGHISPDGKWVVYQSNMSNRSEIYIQRFPMPGPGGRQQVSADGGRQPRWGPGGKEIFYLGPQGEFMAVPVRVIVAEDRTEVGTPQVLFTARLPTESGGWQYAVARDGQRFLFDTLKEQTLPITVLLNWHPPN